MKATYLLTHLIFITSAKTLIESNYDGGFQNIHSAIKLEFCDLRVYN